MSSSSHDLGLSMRVSVWLLLAAGGTALCQDTTVIDFEEFEACSGSVAGCSEFPTTFLASRGIADMIIDGPAGAGGPVIISSRNDPPFVHSATSGANIFEQLSTTPRPHSLTLVFTKPLNRFGFSRISTAGGGSSTPKWTAEALDSTGQVIDVAGETSFQVSAPARSLSLRAPAGGAIASVRITSDNRLSPSSPDNVWSTFNSVPLDDFELVPLGASLTLDKGGSLDTAAAGNPGVIEPGDQIDYTLTVSNTGTAPLSSISINDPSLPVIDCPGGHPIATLAIGASIVCTGSYALTQIDIDAAEMRNTATATGLDSDLDPVSDTATHRQILGSRQLGLISSLDLPGATGLAIAPSGKIVVLRRFAPDDQRQSLSVVDLSQTPPSVVTSSLAELGFPLGIGVDPLGRRAYVGISRYVGSRRSSANSRLDIFDLQTVPPAFVESVFDSPHFDLFGLSGVAVAPSGTRVVAANRGDGKVEVFATEPATDSYSLLASVSTGGGAAISVAYSPDGLRAYAVSRSSTRRPGACCAGLVVVDPLSNPPSRITSFDLNIGPGAAGTHLVVTSDGRTTYAVVSASPQLSPPLLSPRIATIDNLSLRETGTLADLSSETVKPGEIVLQRLALSSDDRWLFLAAVVDARTFLYVLDLLQQPAAVTQRLEIGGPGSVDLAVGHSSSDRVYVTNFESLLVFGFSERAMPDADGDGVDGVTEDAGPNGGDGNGDGILDSLQGDVTSIPSATPGGAYITLVTVPSTVSADLASRLSVSSPGTVGACRNRTVQAIDPLELPPDQVVHTDVVESFVQAQGLICFEVDCAAATFTVIYHGESDLGDAVYRKFGARPNESRPHWYTIPSVFGTLLIGGFPAATATFDIVDGALGDDLLTPDGRIIDQGGAALPAFSTAIPTLSGWSLIILMALLGSSAVVLLRR